MIYRRFSCVGFVIEAYRAAGIDLLITDENDLPLISYQELRRVYPLLGRLATNRRKQFGIVGDGPFRIVLPGYLFHSLTRTYGVIRRKPYKPRSGDEQFAK